MESIEKLRTVARNMAKGMNLENHEECNLLLIIANEIEREIAEEHRRAIAELQAENDELRKLLVGAYKDMDAWQMVISSSDQWGYGKGCLEQLYKLRDAMRELGIEVE